MTLETHRVTVAGLVGIGIAIGAVLGYLACSSPKLPSDEQCSGVRLIPSDPDILLVDVRAPPILVYTTENISLARTLSNVSDEDMEHFQRIANMTVEERETYVDGMLARK